MEFENNTPTDEEQLRMEASARRRVIHPVSTAVLPEPSEGVDLNTRLSATAHQPNVTTDHEDTSVQLKRYAEIHSSKDTATSHPSRLKTLLPLAAACSCTAALLWMFVQ